LTSDRPYKKAFSIEKSNQIILQERGKHFDPEVVDAFFEVQDAILQIKASYQEDQESLLLYMDRIAGDYSVLEQRQIYASK
jgi:putative two-component system response regulator